MQYIVLKNYINFINILYMTDIQLLQSCTTGGMFTSGCILLFIRILINEKAIPCNAVQLEEIPHPVRNRDAG